MTEMMTLPVLDVFGSTYMRPAKNTKQEEDNEAASIMFKFLDRPQEMDWSIHGQVS